MTKGDKWSLLVFVSTMAIVLSIFFYNRFDRQEKWSNSSLEKRYTVAKITKYRHAGKTPPWFEYAFEFNGSSYEGTHSILSKIGLLPRKVRESFAGKHYYVKFIAEDPEYSKLLMGYPVPDSIKEAPVRGWKKLPR